jgi:hypothetical protein
MTTETIDITGFEAALDGATLIHNKTIALVLPDAKPLTRTEYLQDMVTRFLQGIDEGVAAHNAMVLKQTQTEVTARARSSMNQPNLG